jgi:hypothetical protein
MAYENMKAGLGASFQGMACQNEASAQKRNTIEDQMRNLNELVQRIDRIKANVRGVSDIICGVSSTPPEGKMENAAVAPGHILYRLSDTIKDGMMVVDGIDRELAHIRSALSDDA